MNRFTKFLKAIHISQFSFYLLLVLIILSLGSLRFYENYLPNLTEPNISLKPFDVVSIQLDSLQRNNIPFKDAGIEQVWNSVLPPM